MSKSCTRFWAAWGIVIVGMASSSASLAGAWTTAPPMAAYRAQPASAVLADGRVLVTGGQFDAGYQSSCEIYDPSSGAWIPAGDMSVPRAGHTATLLSDGRVLVAGGYYQDAGGVDHYLDSAEVYDPASGAWAPVGSMGSMRGGHTATLLPNGKVLVAGGGYRDSGGSDHPFSSAELYDPSPGTWSATGSMTTARAGHTATLLQNGKVLAAGGATSITNYLSSSEEYNPAAGTWSAAGSMSAGHAVHTAVLLASGKVLLSGGMSGFSTTSSSQLYNPATRSWQSAPSMGQSRAMHAAVLLQSGKVLVAGGMQGTVLSFSTIGSAEVYDPAANSWASIDPMALVRQNHAGALLPSGKVLVAGGAYYSGGATVARKEAELYTPPAPCTLACSASASPISGTAPLSVSFGATSTPANCTGTVSYQWAFGDGQSSSQQSPTHVYTSAGTFTWTLTATIAGVTCSQTGAVTVTAPCTLSCSAAGAPSSGPAPLAVAFSASAAATGCSGTPTFAWTFGDGQGASQQNPVHTYALPGIYTWTMTAKVTGATCSKTGTVTVAAGCALTCTASAQPLAGEIPLEVAFSASVTAIACGGAPSYSWSFGDGASSAEQDPLHTYSSAGSYTWWFSVRQDGQICTASGTVTATEPCSLSCRVEATVQGSSAPVSVAFSPVLEDAGCGDSPAFLWDFGDGSSSCEEAPTHDYATPGLYTWRFFVYEGGFVCGRMGTLRVPGLGGPPPPVQAGGGTE